MRRGIVYTMTGGTHYASGSFQPLRPIRRIRKLYGMRRAARRS